MKIAKKLDVLLIIKAVFMSEGALFLKIYAEKFLNVL